MIQYPIISLYLIRVFIKQFLLTSCIVIAVLLISNTFDVLQKFKSNTIGLAHFWSLIGYKIPYLFNEVSIITGFITTFLFIQKIRKNNEFVIILSSGISIWQVFLIPIITTFALGVLILLTITPIASYCLIKYEKLEAKITGTKNANLTFSQSGVFLYEFIDQNSRIIQASSIDVNQDKLLDPTILVMDSQKELLHRIDAREAIIYSGFLKLSDVKIFYKTHTKIMSNLELPTNLSMNSLLLGFKPPEKINFWHMRDSIQQFSKYGLAVIKYQLYYFKQLFKPLAMMAISFTACWFVSLNLRESQNANVIKGIVLGMSTYFFLEFAFRILAYTGLYPFYAILLPIIFVILISNFVILHFQEA